MAPESVPHRIPLPRGGDERRGHPRTAADWPVTIALEDGHHRARLRDVSRSGVCFYLDRPIPEMTLLRLDLEVPGDGEGRRVTGTGVVVRCSPISAGVDHYEIAVFLNDMGEADRDRLTTLGPRRPPHPPDDPGA